MSFYAPYHGTGMKGKVKNELNYNNSILGVHVAHGISLNAMPFNKTQDGEIGLECVLE